MLLKIRYDNLLSMMSLNLQLNLQFETPPVGDLPMLWDEIGLWEPIWMEKGLEIFERKPFLFAEIKNLCFFLMNFVKKNCFLLDIYNSLSFLKLEEE